MIAVLNNPAELPAMGDVALYTCELPSGPIAAYYLSYCANRRRQYIGYHSAAVQIAIGRRCQCFAWDDHSDFGQHPGGRAIQLRMIVATSGYGTDVVAVNRDWVTIVSDKRPRVQNPAGYPFRACRTPLPRLRAVFGHRQRTSRLDRLGIFTKRCLSSTRTRRQL